MLSYQTTQYFPVMPLMASAIRWCMYDWNWSRESRSCMNQAGALLIELISCGVSFTPSYRPQTKFAKVMFFTPVCHSVHRGKGVSTSVHTGYTSPWEQTPQEQTPAEAHTSRSRHLLGAETSPRADTPPEQTHPRQSRPPPAQCMLGDTGNKWAVRILLECILVH